MSEHTWNTNDKPPASQFEEDLHKQTVIRCTSTTRGATWVGKHIFETDTGRRRHWNGTAWQTHPDGMIGHATIIASSALTSTLVAVPHSTVSFDGNSEENYLYMLDFTWQSSVPGDVITVFVEADSGTGFTAIDAQRDFVNPATGYQNAVSLTTFWSPPTTGVGMQFRTRVSMVGSGFGFIPGGTDVTLLHIGSGLS